MNTERIILMNIDTHVLALWPQYQLLLWISDFYFRKGIQNMKTYTPIYEVSCKLWYDFAMLLPVHYALSGYDSTSPSCLEWLWFYQSFMPWVAMILPVLQALCGYNFTSPLCSQRVWFYQAFMPSVAIILPPFTPQWLWFYQSFKHLAAMLLPVLHALSGYAVTSPSCSQWLWFY